MVHAGLATPLAVATQAGNKAVAAGGNAIDAALTAAAVLTVAYPHNCSIGGDIIALVRAPDGATTCVNASGRSAVATDVAGIRTQYQQMPLRGPSTVTVPGAVSGWEAIHKQGAQLSWERLLAPAIALARDGVTVSPGMAAAIVEDAGAIEQYPAIHRMLAPDGEWLTAGQTLRQPALAESLTMLAKNGPTTFYRGDLSRALSDGARELGIALALDDLAAHRVDLLEPLTVDVEGWRVSSAPPNSQGFALLRLLALREFANHHGGALAPTEVAQAFLTVSHERDAILADADAMKVDVSELLRKASVQKLADASVDHVQSQAGSGHRPNGDTVAVAAADSEGRSVSLIQSIYYGFGSLLLDESTGVLFHNRGACFSLDPNSPNVLAPSKRPMHTLTPVLAERESTRLALGTMGGEMQPQILYQVLTKLMHGLAPQECVALPRWTVGPWDRDDPPTRVTFEENIDHQLLRGLAAWNGPQHSIAYGTSEVGHAQAVRVSKTGDDIEIQVGTDPRADGLLNR